MNTVFLIYYFLFLREVFMQLVRYIFILFLGAMSASPVAYGADFEYSQNSINKTSEAVIDELTAVKKAISYYSLIKNNSKKDDIEWYVSTFRGDYFPLYGEIIFQDQGFIVFKALKFLREKKCTFSSFQKEALSEAILNAYRSLDNFGKYRFTLYFEELLETSQGSLTFDKKTILVFDNLIQESLIRTLKVGIALEEELSFNS